MQTFWVYVTFRLRANVNPCYHDDRLVEENWSRVSYCAWRGSARSVDVHRGVKQFIFWGGHPPIHWKKRASLAGEQLAYDREAIKKLLVIQSRPNRSATCIGQKPYTTTETRASGFGVDSLPWPSEGTPARSRCSDFPWGRSVIAAWEGSEGLARQGARQVETCWARWATLSIWLYGFRFGARKPGSVNQDHYGTWESPARRNRARYGWGAKIHHAHRR